MMRNLLIIVITALLLALPASAQEFTPEPTPAFAWCGYIFIGGVYIGEDEIASLARLFADELRTNMPHEMMGYIYNNLGDLIMDGCMLRPPSRGLFVSYIEQASAATYETIDEQAEIIIFADGGTRQESLAAVSEFIVERLADWTTDETETP